MSRTAKPATGQRPLVVTIRASEWARGIADPLQRLISNDGKKCCLGFDGLACGVPMVLLAEAHVPSQMIHTPSTGNYIDAWMGDANEAFAGYVDPTDHTNIAEGLDYQAAFVNDNPATTDDEKIARLRPIFRAAHPPRIIRWLPNR